MTRATKACRLLQGILAFLFCSSIYQLTAAVDVRHMQVVGEFVPSCMQQLKRIVDSTSCVIVVSSTWRETPVSLRALLRQLQVYGMPTVQYRFHLIYMMQQAGINASSVVGCTPVLGARAAEIVEWLRRERGACAGCARYCVLDDWDISGSGFDISRFVQCDSSQGLTTADADAAIALLNQG